MAQMSSLDRPPSGSGTMFRGEVASPERRGALQGVAVYTVTTLALVTIVAVLMRAFGVAIATPTGAAFILAGMWVPALARLVATRSVDRS